MNIYAVLGIQHHADEHAIKRAYSSKIKQFRPETHPAEFAQIREAYEDALQQFRSQWKQENEYSPPTIVLTASEADEVLLSSENSGTDGTEYERQSLFPDCSENIAASMIGELNNQAILGNEQGLLQVFYAQIVTLSELSLDRQMDYEQELLFWLLFADCPSLHMFAAANAHYKWMSDSLAIDRSYGEFASRRLIALHLLSTIYLEVKKGKNKFLRLAGEQVPRMASICDHYSLIRAQEQNDAWQQECRDADFAQLSQLLSYVQHKSWQLFWADFAMGMLMAWCGWLLLRAIHVQYIWFGVAIIGVCATLLPVLFRVTRKLFKENHEEL
ncbi:MAG: hypothetical protein R8K20_08145, partial [Gallionellaceae bacterium]